MTAFQTEHIFYLQRPGKVLQERRLKEKAGKNALD
jgi:hypothetical protein